MAKAEVILDYEFDFSDRFRATVKVFGVRPSFKFPSGIKARYVLTDRVLKVALLLIDNHEPFGFHVHDGLPDNKDARRLLDAKDYLDALKEFWILAKEILDDKN